MYGEKRICTSCGCVLGEHDDIVTCPDCGLVYHKYCYNTAEEGQCRCRSGKPVMHAPVQNDVRENFSVPDDSQSGIICPSCRTVVKEAVNFCPYCGEVLISPRTDTETALIGTGIQHYSRKFSDIRGGNIISWNWWSLLWTPFWCFYRKMYIEGLAAVAIQFAASRIDQSGLLQFLIYIVFALIGNAVYMNHIERLKNKADDLEGEEREQFIRSRGGVSYAAAVLFGLAYFGLAYFFAAAVISIF